MRTIALKEAFRAMQSVFPDHRPSSRVRIGLAENLWKHAIWLGSAIRVTVVESRSSVHDEDILRVLSGGPLMTTRRFIVINGVGTEARPPGAPLIRGAFVCEGEGLEAFLGRYRREVWSRLFEGDTIIVALDVHAAGVFHNDYVILRLGRPDFLRALRRRNPDMRVDIVTAPSEASRDWRAVVKGDGFILEACGDNEEALVRQVLQRMPLHRAGGEAVVIAYLDSERGMSDGAVREIERCGALAADRRSMDVLLDLVAPKQDNVSQWEVDSEDRLQAGGP